MSTPGMVKSRIEAGETTSHFMLAHVRAATVGAVDPSNVHPFRHGPWVFAHNGTLTSHAELAAMLADSAHVRPAGTTDSELVFQWLLGRMPEFGLHPHRPASDSAIMARLLEHVVLDLVRASLPLAVAPPRLNLPLSDGRRMVASRWGNSLYWTIRTGVRDCEPADRSYRAVVPASEPITEDVWVEVQEGTIAAVDEHANVFTRDLLTRAAS